MPQTPFLFVKMSYGVLLICIKERSKLIAKNYYYCSTISGVQKQSLQVPIMDERAVKSQNVNMEKTKSSKG